MRLLKILSIGAFVVLTGIILTLNHLIPLKQSDKKIKQYFSERQINLRIHHLDHDGKNIRVLESFSNTSDSNLLVIVHGAPGSATDYTPYLEDSSLLQNFRIIAIDRPGYGKSDYGNAVTSITAQAEALKRVIDNFPAKKVILAGHSYGGPIAAKFAMDHPDKVDALVMLAPVNDPDNERIFWFSPISKWKLTKWPFAKAYNVASREKYAHAAELAKIQAGWAQLEVPTIHAHGTKDEIAPMINVNFSQKNIAPEILETVIFPNAEHDIPWSKFEAIKAILLKALNRVKERV